MKNFVTSKVRLNIKDKQYTSEDTYNKYYPHYIKKLIQINKITEILRPKR